MTDQPTPAITQWYKKLARPIAIGRLRHFPAPMWLWWAAMEIAAYRPPRPHWLYVGSWIMLILWLPLWALMTRGRLIDLRLNPYWVVPLAAVWCVLILACRQTIWWLMLSSFVLVVLLELPLIFLPGRLRDENGERVEPA
jgi:hypothetical protein